jgi:putative glycerol-1-phosphate prenyltransferase
MQQKKKVLINKISALKATNKKAIAVLIDPDKVVLEQFTRLLNLSIEHQVDFFFVGGSLITTPNIHEIISQIKKHTSIPVLLFPGNSMHIDTSADGILFLSLISGRNPDFLIGQHVVAAPLLRQSNLEIISTGYMIIESGRPTTVSYISNTTPIPHNKPDIAACTAMAGEMLGMQLMYLDAGSGAQYPVTGEMIKAVRKSVDTPLIVGGGINSGEKAQIAFEAGADIIIIGNGIEKNVDLLTEIAQITTKFNQG